MQRLKRKAPILVALLLLLVSCRKQQVREQVVYTLWLPYIAHDCSWIAVHADYVQAVVRCEDRILRERFEGQRVIMPGACSTPEPQDYVTEQTPEACYPD